MTPSGFVPQVIGLGISTDPVGLGTPRARGLPIVALDTSFSAGEAVVRVSELNVRLWAEMRIY